MMGCKIAHGTTFRRAVEEGLLDLKRVVQIGLRGTSYTPTDFQWSVDQVFALLNEIHNILNNNKCFFFFLVRNIFFNFRICII